VRQADVVYVLVNPRLSSSSEETYVDDEACLSLPGVPVPVERPFAVAVQACDPKGQGLELALEGQAARVVQHELDHLDGILIVDRVRADARRRVLGDLRALVTR